MQKKRSSSPSWKLIIINLLELHSASPRRWQLQSCHGSTASCCGRCALRLARPVASPRPRGCLPARGRQHRRPTSTRDGLAEVGDRNSEAWRSCFSAYCMRCTSLLDATPEPPLGREASGHVPWVWAERRRPSPKRKGSSSKWVALNFLTTIVILNPDLGSNARS